MCQAHSQELKVFRRKEMGSRKTRSCLKVSMALIWKTMIANDLYYVLRAGLCFEWFTCRVVSSLLLGILPKTHIRCLVCMLSHIHTCMHAYCFLTYIHTCMHAYIDTAFSHTFIHICIHNTAFSHTFIHTCCFLTYIHVSYIHKYIHTYIHMIRFIV